GYFGVKDSQDDLLDEIKEIFKYEIFTDENNFVVSLEMPYIKHNTTVAFPSLILLKEPIDKLAYEITSKYMQIKQFGELSVKYINEINA
ncbi:MAG: hypothetical protein J6U77_06945, partial [Verrucomicrobia bacterium]|nr:hypothetical protein [Verrucomicrobiota bacterium]